MFLQDPKQFFFHPSSDKKSQELADDVRADGGMALPIKADSGDPEALNAAIAQTVGRFGRIDIPVNNGGLLGPHGITVNVVQPGPTETDTNAAEERRAMVRTGGMSGAYLNRYLTDPAARGTAADPFSSQPFGP